MAEPVAPEVLERFRDGFECWNRHELDRMAAMYTEDAEFDVSAVFTDVAPMRGRASMQRYWAELREIWDGIRMEPLAAFDLGGGRYVVDVRLCGTGLRSGAETDQSLTMLYALRAEDGKIASARLLPDVATGMAVAEAAAERE